MKTQFNVPYYSDEERAGDPYLRERCVLDLKIPEDNPGFATVVWLHGGGMTAGEKFFLDGLGDGVAQAAVNYRLAPRCHHPDYLLDAAAATAWVMKRVAGLGGDPGKVFLAGNSAGGYLAAMVGMDPRWLKARGEDPARLAGIVLVSVQVTTHFVVKKLMGDTGEQFRPLIDEFAPLYYVSKDLPPICVVTGDRKLDFPCRVEENELFVASLRQLGHPMVELHELAGLDHGGVSDRGYGPLCDFVRKVSRLRDDRAALGEHRA